MLEEWMNNEYAEEIGEQWLKVIDFIIEGLFEEPDVDDRATPTAESIIRFVEWWQYGMVVGVIHWR